MTDLIASLFRGINSTLTRFRNPLIHRCVKLIYGLSALFYQSGLGRSPRMLLINNFDGDASLLIDPSRNMGASIYWTGYHELHELLFLSRYIKPGMVFIDAGANIGLFSVWAARRVYTGKVISFEPVPVIADWLYQNVQLNSLTNVIVERYGLSDHEGMLPIYEIDSSNEGLSTLYPSDIRTKRVTEVPVRRLDQLFPTYNLERLDFIKVDIEGGELPALRGAEMLLRKFRPVVMAEINQLAYLAAGYRPSDVYEFFSNLRYKPYIIDRTGHTRAELSPSTFNNIVFIPE